MKVIKRDGREVEYNGDKVIGAIIKAMTEVEGFVDMDCAESIESIVRDNVEDNDQLSVEEIQDIVEVELMSHGYSGIAKAYILYRAKREEKRSAGWEMSELQEDIFNSKYRYKNENFDEFIHRVSGGDSEIAKLIRNQEFMFGGRILAGRGIGRNVSLANCTTLPPVEDNIESIFGTAGQLARMFSYGQGAGIDISNLRPKGAKVNNASKTSTGAVSFMQIYDSVSNVIGAEGRRAALLIALDASHGDAFDFVDIKKDVGQINNANISLKTDAEFFKQDTQRKRDLLDKIAENNHAMGEPGMLFWDNIEDWHLLSNDPNYTIEGVNACSEYTTTRFGTCVLGSINLSKFVLNPFTDTAAIDKDRLISAIRTVTRAMDDVADEAIASHPLEEQRQVGADYRSIGIGIMGLADMFIQLGVEYGSKESLKVANIVGAALRDTAFRTSIDIAKEKGAYPKFKYESVKDAPYFKALPKDIQEGIKQHGIRNNSLLSIAPAGTISLLANASSGLEPVFANSFIRTTKSLSGEGDRDYKIFTKVIKDLMEAKGIAKEEDLPSYCVTAHDIDPLDRVELQGTLQHYVDLAISSTVNLKEEATVEDIKEVYKAAHEKGLKGVTVFRNNCFRVGILNTEDKPKEENKGGLESNVEPAATTKDDNIVREEDMLNCST